MIETLDPNLNMPPPLQPDAKQVEPIRPESVKIEEQKLERKKPREEGDEGKRRDRKDKVELSSQQEASGDAPEGEEEPVSGDSEKQDDHQIDIFI
ncbi:MAG: hypothetical protein GH143_08560 [Calditrichaeota bacterium]|nr:hypothetical protein [Calditrichota bacterium]